MLKIEIAEFLAANVAGVGNKSYEINRYMKMNKIVLESMLDEATAPTPEDRGAAVVRTRQALTTVANRAARGKREAGRFVRNFR